MSGRPQIPAVEGVQDKQVASILAPMKLILESMTGRMQGRSQIQALNGSANLAGIINKVNEVVARMQGSDIASVLPTTTAGVASKKIGTFTRNMSTASGTQAVTGIGFKPKILIFVSCSDVAAVLTTGFDDGTTHTNGAVSNSAGTLAFTTSTAQSVIVSNDNTFANFQTALIQSLDADGFTMVWTKIGSPTGTATVNYVAFS